MPHRRAHALVIGVGAYPNSAGVQPLRFARRDAEELVRVLTRPDASGFAPEHVKLLVDDQATRQGIMHHLSKWLPESSREDEIALIYFAGHGMLKHVGAREKGYLMPFDADPDDIVTHGISMSDVNEAVQALQAAAVVVCLDCCHAGKVTARNPVDPAAIRGIGLRPSMFQEMAGK